MMAGGGPMSARTNRRIPVRRLVAALLVALVAGLAAYTALDLRRAKGLATEACARAREGMPLDEYLRAGAGADYRLIKGPQEILLVPRSGMGRYHCAVSHDGLKITGAKVNFLD